MQKTLSNSRSLANILVGDLKFPSKVEGSRVSSGCLAPWTFGTQAQGDVRVVGERDDRVRLVGVQELCSSPVQGLALAPPH